MTHKKEPKSKFRLRNALNELMEKQHFTQISVNDICAQAYVGRSTFYEHFQDKYDLLMYSLNTFYEELSSHLENETDVRRIELVLEAIKLQSQFLKRLLRSDLNHEVNQIIRKVWNDKIESRVQEGSHLDEFSIRFAAGGVVFMILRWIETDCDEPVEDFAKALNDIFKRLEH
ncbi:hypothetical protein AOC36_10435 [Erysipelothrix larvae]|uniref:HTH tetR-type domain-containing protein n=1 Tax=Erysipelothrix larvae TaxID=1514105 RepID=A0A0X8H1J2_9FIRM|nr:TetR/AcrR family transcriptional regulator C-terminal domain-containing protein [Erysipelothrix larvae]AMC94373.1 hypothetical protein AOC36_10435 [Erysipelothrix larvae]